MISVAKCSGQPLAEPLALNPNKSQQVNTIADSFGSYVKQQFSKAEDRPKRRLAGLHTLPPPDAVPADQMPACRVEAECPLEKGDETTPMRAI